MYSYNIQVVSTRNFRSVCVLDDIRPIIYVPYVYLVKLIYFIFLL